MGLADGEVLDCHVFIVSGFCGQGWFKGSTFQNRRTLNIELLNVDPGRPATSLLDLPTMMEQPSIPDVPRPPDVVGHPTVPKPPSPPGWPEEPLPDSHPVPPPTDPSPPVI
jgi:hypothetical protein